MNEKLLDIVCCPISHQPLRKADRPLLADLNTRIESGTVVNEAGKSVTGILTEALVTRDGRRLYPVHDGLVSLLADESVVLEQSP